jgi:aryl carrier-like protein
MAAAKVLFNTIGSVIGRSTRNTLSIDSNYYRLGGNSLNSIYTITRLKEQGYTIGITEFITAKNLGQVLNLISNDSSDIYKWLPKEKQHYRAETLTHQFKEKCLK